MSKGSRYARGDKAWAHCERCGDKVLLKQLKYDGQYPDLQVCLDCWDEKHPQEWLPGVFDPVTLYDPTFDLDRPNTGEGVSGDDPYPPASCTDSPDADTGCDGNNLGYIENALLTANTTAGLTITIDTASNLDPTVCVYVETSLAGGVFTAHDIDVVSQGDLSAQTTIHLQQPTTGVIGSRVYLGVTGTGVCRAPPFTTILLVFGDPVVFSGEDFVDNSGETR